MNAGSANGDARTLEHALARLAREPHLLVACDYDGTLAPIVDVPGEARPRRESVAALRALAALPDTSVAVISGRSLHDLAALSRLPEEIHLVGSHGTEFDVGFARALAPEARELRDRVTEELHAIAAPRPGVTVEHKPAGAALHYRQASEEDGQAALIAVRDGPATLPGVHPREGKRVIELAVVQADKGFALDAIRHQVGASAAVFIGDDVTDEDAFSRLTGPDLGIKVGDGPTFAKQRVDDPEDVARLLARLLETRRDWLAGANAVPIERHAMLSDGKTVALVTPDARITWMCHPRPDSAPLFAELVAGQAGGALSVRPAHEGAPTAQRYVEGTLTLETRWAGLIVSDYLDRGDPYGRVRLVRVLEGTAEAVVEFAPRPDFGRMQIALRVHPDGVVVLGAADPVSLYAPGLTWEIVDDPIQPIARALVPADDRPYVLELRCGGDSLSPHPAPEPERRERTETSWRTWVEGLRLPALARGEITRSALTLRGLCHEQTGAILAAATTSLPEEIGGVRNWDYRYCWLRDAALTALALVELGSATEAESLLGYIDRLAQAEQDAERLRPLYSVMGGDAGTEAVIDAVPGYAGSRPVRVGNAAAQQVQLDVFGPIVELAYELAVAGGNVTETHHLLVEQIVDAVARRWDEPDHGIWEIRRPPRHHVHSRVMCWLAVDRALRLARLTGRPEQSSWSGLADRIAADVLERGWKAEARSFTAAYDGVDLDAAALQIGLCGLLPADDDRFAATVEAVELRLREGPTVYRYRSDDGLPGSEGGFHLCALWLAHAYALVGRQSDAHALFDQVLELAGPTGLLSEQYDPRAERALGNHPQAYSHLGLIRTALVLDRLPR